jgi:hypothetical protein
MTTSKVKINLSENRLHKKFPLSENYQKHKSSYAQIRYTAPLLLGGGGVTSAHCQAILCLT